MPWELKSGSVESVLIGTSFTDFYLPYLSALTTLIVCVSCSVSASCEVIARKNASDFWATC